MKVKFLKEDQNCTCEREVQNNGTLIPNIEIIVISLMQIDVYAKLTLF